MKFQSAFTIALSASTTFALSIPKRDVNTEQLFTVELTPGTTKQVTEAEKWELRKVSLMPASDHGGS
jgi:leucyl aminopeptidase